MDDNRNLILAVVLAALILFGWPIVQEQFFPNPEQASGEVSSPNEAAPPGGAAQVAPVKPARARALKEALTDGDRVRIETPKVEGSIALKGARFDDLLLTDHGVTAKKDSPPVRLLSPSGTSNAYFAELGWANGEGGKVAVPGPDTVWTADSNKLTPETPVTLSWDNGAGQRFEIKYSIDKNYLVTAEQSVTNRGDAPVALASYGAVSRKGESEDKSTWTIHVGPMGVFDGEVDYDWDYSEIDEDGTRGSDGDHFVEFSKTDWLGFTDHYWLTAIIPAKGSNPNGYFVHSAQGDIYNVRSQDASASLIRPGMKQSKTVRIFAGAKEVNILNEYTDKLGIPKFNLAIDWGWFGVIERPMFALLDWLFKLIGNFGVAIIGLTVIVRLLLFPVAQKQFASMASMRAVQPKQKAIQEKYKDDKQRQQQEIMKLFKEEKVNPLAGCLPIFLQIPIFFALYKVLMLTIDMRHQPFLYIKDLSAPDPMTPVNLFGLLPFDPPSFLTIGILPILVGLTMWLQQRLNPAPADPVQAQVFAFMPWILMVFMAPFAAGLQLYWTTNNVLSILQQRLLYARNPQMREMMKKEAEDRAAKKAEKEKKAGA